MSATSSFSNPAPTTFNLAAYCIGQNPLRPDDEIGLIFVSELGHQKWTWGQLRHRCAQWQQAIQGMGVRPGDRVALLLPNSVDTPLALLAGCGFGAIPIILSPQLRDEEILYILEDSGASLVIGRNPADSKVPSIEAADIESTKSSPTPIFTEFEASTPGYMVYTSGTSGKPRGVLHAHRAVWGRRPMQAGWTGIGKDDRVLHAGQLNWTYAMGITVFDTWPVGGQAILYEGPRNAVVWSRLLREFTPTIFAAVPGVYRQLVRDIETLASDTASLRHGLCAGEPLPPSLHGEWLAITGKDLFEALGMSEISTYVSSGPVTATRAGSPGKPQPGRIVTLLPANGGEQPVLEGETGVIAVHRSDPGLMLQYWNNSSATGEAFRGEWFLTGDCAHFDQDGYLWYEGRADDVINALGYRVGPTEIEVLLAKHPGIVEAAVCGITIREGVTLVCAYMVPTSEGGLPSLASLQRHVASHLADWKHPRVWRFVRELPRNARGKVLRRQLHDAWDNAEIRLGEAF